MALLFVLPMPSTLKYGFSLIKPTFLIGLLLCLPGQASASDDLLTRIDLTLQWPGIFAMSAFLVAMVIISFEKKLNLSKSKPLILAAGLIWAVIGFTQGVEHQADESVRHYLLQYVEIMLFLLVIMTYINALNERGIFATIRSKLVGLTLSYRAQFWIIGSITFVLSPLIGSLFSALLMVSILMACHREHSEFASLSCINIVVAANAGGVFSPFGAITSLLLWQQQIMTPQGLVDFLSMLYLVIPALVAYVVPAFFMARSVPQGVPVICHEESELRRGAFVIAFLFIFTLAMSLMVERYLHLPYVIGIMSGLACLQLFGYYLKMSHRKGEMGGEQDVFSMPTQEKHRIPFDIFQRVSKADWETLFYLYGLVLSIGGLTYLGWSHLAEILLFDDLGPFWASVVLGIYSAGVENITSMMGLLTMQPDVSLGHWLNATLAIGIGGSMLPIGSLAGLALMAHSRGYYNFFSHLRWTPVIALGFAASLLTHQTLNSQIF